MRDQKNDPTLDPTLAVSISTFPLTPYYLDKNISNKTALTNKPENTPLPHVEKIIYIKKEKYNTSSDNILKELGNVALLFSIVLLFLLLLYLALYFSKK